MNRSSSLTKFMQKQTDRAAATGASSLDFSDEDSMQSESVYTRGVFGGNDDYADDLSCASSIASSGIFGLQLESSVRRLSSHHALEEDNTTSSSSRRGSILYDDIEKQQNEKDGLDWDMESKAVDVRNVKSDDVSVTSNSSGEESSSEDSSSDESSVSTATGEGPLACYRNSSRRFKIALFITSALVLAFLAVALLMLFGVIDHGVPPGN